MDNDDDFIPATRSSRLISRRSRFSAEEDELLKNLVELHGTEDWKLIASKMTKRNERQVRDRWRIWLDPEINREPFTPDEDDLIRELYDFYGPKWVLFTSYFNKRTDVALKCRWKTINRAPQPPKKPKRVKEIEDFSDDKKDITEISILDDEFERECSMLELNKYFPYF